MSDVEKLQRFIEKHPDAKCDGFFWWQSEEYRCVVVALVVERGLRRAEAAEFRAATAAELIAAATDAGLELGETTHVARLCESARHLAPKPRRRLAAIANLKGPR